jgi:hypothetical protein
LSGVRLAPLSGADPVFGCRVRIGLIKRWRVSGTWTKGVWRLTVSLTCCGEPVIRMGRRGIAWYSGGATSRPPKSASASASTGCPTCRLVMVPDNPTSSAAAEREIVVSVEYRRHREWNNRAENSHRRHVSEGEVCSALAQLARPNGSSPSLAPLLNTAVRADTASPLLPIGRSGRDESRAGERPQVSPWPLERDRA